MPELPEVETVRAGLSQFLPGKVVADVIFDWPKGFPNAEADVSRFLIGARITEVKRRAKVLMIELDSKYTLLVHLKMTGQLVYIGHSAQPPLPRHSRGGGNPVKKTAIGEVRFGAGHPNDSLVGSLPDRSTRVTLAFADGSHLFFNDQRKFGWMRLLPTTEVMNLDFFQKVGPEPLAADFTAKDFRDRIRRRPTSIIKAVLLDQTVIAGVGNIYADESLWGAKIHPATRVTYISDAELDILYTELRDVLQLAIQKGGSSDKNYVNAEGKRGSYLSFARVFRREGKPCSRCETIIIKTKLAGRGTHICPHCQRQKGSA